MPAYSNVTPAVAIYTRQSIALVNNAATDAGVTKTMRVAMAVEPNGNGALTLINNTNQAATVQLAAVDADGSYVPLGTVAAAAGAATQFACNGPWVRCVFGTAPTTGSLWLTR
jgi:hypothetical protein